MTKSTAQQVSGAAGTKTTDNVVADVLTIDDAATYLSIARSTLYKLVRRNAVPHMKIGGAVRFSRRVLLEWVETESRKSIR